MAFRIVVESLPDSEAFWMIGDSMGADIEAAEAVGIPGILVRKPHRDAARYCESLSQVPSVLSGS
jgi:FMN phosphatase YigB (HAD superfamily)